MENETSENINRSMSEDLGFLKAGEKCKYPLTKAYLHYFRAYRNLEALH
jgi:hypothetical protein